MGKGQIVAGVDRLEGTLSVRVLGSSSGLPSASRDTTSLLVGSSDDWTLVDCPGSVVHKLARLGISPGQLRRLILTHSHVDHVYGLPHLLHALAVAGKNENLSLHAPGQTLATVRDMVATHSLEGPRYPRLQMKPIAMHEGTVIVDDGRMRIEATPARHGRDTVALRFEIDGIAVCLSSDTCACAAVTVLARHAQLLIHDCAGPHRLRDGFGGDHSSALEAARAATDAAARNLVLIHLGPEAESALGEMLAEARAAFSGPVVVAADGDEYRVSKGLIEGLVETRNS